MYVCLRKLFFSAYLKADTCLLLDTDQVIMRDLRYLWDKRKELLTPTTYAAVTGLRNIAEIRRYCDNKGMPKNCHPHLYLTSINFLKSFMLDFGNKKKKSF